MIVSYRNKALELYASKGDRSKLQQKHIDRIKTILSRLHAATTAQMMNQPGYNFHRLTGEFEGFYAVTVSDNYRIIFRFEGENAYDVDYLDCH